MAARSIGADQGLRQIYAVHVIFVNDVGCAGLPQLDPPWPIDLSRDHDDRPVIAGAAHEGNGQEGGLVRLE